MVEAVRQAAVISWDIERLRGYGPPNPFLQQVQRIPQGTLISHRVGGLIDYRILQYPKLVDGNPHDIPWLEPDFGVHP